MNQDNQIVPIVEDDQGEGWLYPLDNEDCNRLTRAEKKLRKKDWDVCSSKHSRSK